MTNLFVSLLFHPKRQRIKQFVDGYLFYETLDVKLLVFSCFSKKYPSHIRRRTKNVMKLNTNTNAIMSSDGDETILWT